MEVDIRLSAVEIYQNCLNGKTDYGFETIAEAQERAFVKRLVMTALRRQEFLKKVIAGYSSKPLPHKMTSIHLLIILGAVEILYFRTPEYAIVSSYVEIAKKLGNKYSGGFVNAILRKICSDCEKISNAANVPFFSKSFRRILSVDYSPKQIAVMEKLAVTEPPLDISVKSNAEQWAHTLDGTLMPNGSIRLPAAGIVSQLNGYDDGQWWVQDIASSLAVQSLGKISGKKVLDLCAAPGGKTAQLLSAGAKVSALDISKPRLQRLKENMQRLNLHPENIICADAIDFLQKSEQTYDIILIDAPCSASGTLRRHPEIVHLKTQDDVQRCAEVQKQFLENAAPHIAAGGILLYAVCSLSKAEGEQQILSFIERHPEFLIKPINLVTIAGKRASELKDLLTPEGFLRCLPSQLSLLGGMDGFFVATLQKE